MKEFFTPEESQKIVSSIVEAEKQCSGEIHVHIGSTCKSDVRDSAAEAFAQLGMHKTQLRNGILFFVAPEQRKFAVIGDKGINAKVDQTFWDDIVSALLDDFRQGSYADGLCKAIGVCGAKLREHFPHQADDKNELPDEVSYDRE